MRIITFVLLVGFSVMNLSKGSVLDNPYHRYCRTNLHGDQDCMLTVAYWFNFVDFRHWLDKLLDPVGDVSLNIHCFNGAYIYLPFPYRARHLKKLKVNNCLIRNYLSEWKAQKNYPDSLKDLEIVHSEIEVDLPTMEDVVSNLVTKETDCGQETLETLVMRNVTFKPVSIKPQTEQQTKSLLDSFQTFLEKMKSVEYMCNYKQLQLLERSGVETLNKNFMDAQTERAYYPRLRTFILNSNNIVNFPVQFSNWREYFPTLREIDLSNNSVENFTFNIPIEKTMNFVPLLINLKNNKIRSVPLNIDKYLSSSPIILDLRENPIECDCNAKRLGNYLRAVRRRFPLYKQLTEFVCSSPTQVKDVKLIYINYEKCSQG